MRHNADYADLSAQYNHHLRATVRESSRACGRGVLPRVGGVLRAITHGSPVPSTGQFPRISGTANDGGAQDCPAEVRPGAIDADADPARRPPDVAEGTREGMDRMAS